MAILIEPGVAADFVWLTASGDVSADSQLFPSVFVCRVSGHVIDLDHLKGKREI